MNKRLITLLGAAVLLVASCAKEKMMHKDAGATHRFKSALNNTTASVASRKEQNYITVAADKDAKALGITVHNGSFKDNLIFDIHANGSLSPLYDHYRYCAPELRNMGCIVDEGRVLVKSENGAWKVIFNKENFLANDKFVLFRLSISYEELSDYLEEKIANHPGYTRYLELDEELDNRSLLSDDEWSNWDEYNKLKSDIESIIAYNNFGSDIVNGKPIVLSQIEVDYDQFRSDDKPIALN